MWTNRKVINNKTSCSQHLVHKKTPGAGPAGRRVRRYLMDCKASFGGDWIILLPPRQSFARSPLRRGFQRPKCVGGRHIQPGHIWLPQQDWDLKTQAETPFPYLHASSPLFRPVFCVLLQRSCVHYTELSFGFVGCSLTKPAQIVDIFSSIIGVFFTHLSSCSQRQVSLPLPFSLFLPAHSRHLICPILTLYYSYFLPCVYRGKHL